MVKKAATKKRLDLSILISVHNTAQWLPECLASLEIQKFLSYEVLICANGQADADALDEIGIVPMIANVEPLALSDALNDLLGKARGDCVMRLDPDDALPEDYNRLLCDQVDLARQGYVVYGNYIDFGEHMSRIHATEATALKLFNGSVGPYNFVAKADFFRAVGGWRENGYEDWDLLVRLLAAGAKPRVLGRVSLMHRVRSDGRLARMKKNHQHHLDAIRRGNAEWFRRNGVVM